MNVLLEQNGSYGVQQHLSAKYIKHKINACMSESVSSAQLCFIVKLRGLICGMGDQVTLISKLALILSHKQHCFDWLISDDCVYVC